MLNNEDLQKVLSMSDGEIKKMIYAVTKAAGGDEKKADKLSSDIPNLKKLLSSLTPEQAEKLLNRTGKAKSEEIYRIIRKE